MILHDFHDKHLTTMKFMNYNNRMTEKEFWERLKLLIEVGIPAKCTFNSEDKKSKSVSLAVETTYNKKFLIIILKADTFTKQP